MAIAAMSGPASAADTLPPECETFLTKYDACIDKKMPADTKEAARAAVQAFRQLISMASTMGGTDTSSTGKLCRDLQDEVKKQAETQSFDCDW